MTRTCQVVEGWVYLSSCQQCWCLLLGQYAACALLPLVTPRCRSQVQDECNLTRGKCMMASMTAPRLGNGPNGICRILDMKSTTTWVARVDFWCHWVRCSFGSISPTSVDLLAWAGKSPSNRVDAESTLWASSCLMSIPRSLAISMISVPLPIP